MLIKACSILILINFVEFIEVILLSYQSSDFSIKINITLGYHLKPINPSSGNAPQLSLLIFELHLHLALAQAPLGILLFLRHCLQSLCSFWECCASCQCVFLLTISTHIFYCIQKGHTKIKIELPYTFDLYPQLFFYSFFGPVSYLFLQSCPLSLCFSNSISCLILQRSA